ncbi:hypothetical protein NEOLEDRAFT_1179003 [Neolentinus lepideus HHB14362 ss-1]|uniref:Uncharacterized protein n=1 Tax=Neolentinus lepideus HHB14362 ss-1 TaxID=1314782 RepID=A0A165S3S9_9AGAM|nr:hypothetical protein NEOLEDRAFT_1179003 [Neolentinus lepideus HHB14362 ss-1]
MAMPARIARDLAPSCTGLGSSAFDTLSNFALTAFNTTLPNANSTGTPLILGDDLSYHEYRQSALTTYSYPYPTPNVTFNLEVGGLVANSEDSTAVSAVYSGYEFDFMTDSKGPVTPATIFCGVPSQDACGGNPVLAINGQTNLFSICQRTGGNSFAEVVYNATSKNSGYDLSSCYSVELCIVSA